ncbi:hypothetical protein QVD17_30011 [Tagetes erecta]|uniref:Hydroxyphenylpyruvate reductase n=1 Tax=Tagetes erecta TaxID=13708 RepID=A0AAD8K4S9_TARER|nr:hypothetical protein QVD17_30011 [Tagetes erecta]
MKNIDVLFIAPLHPYLEEQLNNRFNLLRLWTYPQQHDFFKQFSGSIRAIVGYPNFVNDREFIQKFPNLEIVSTFSVGVNHVDLEYCKEKGIRVTNTPDVLTEDVADLAIGLMLATLRKICDSDRFVRSGSWKEGDFILSTKYIYKEDVRSSAYQATPLSLLLHLPSVDQSHQSSTETHTHTTTTIMEAIGVLMTCPMSSYLEQQLSNRFNLIRMWNISQKNDFFNQNSNSIRAVVGNASAGADKELIDSLPALEIVSSFSVGLDKVDLEYCKEKGIRVTNTPDVLTEDVADLAIGLMLTTLRGICECDRYVRSGLWKKGDFKLTTKFSGKKVGIIGLGRIGAAIAKRAEAFNCPISYYSRSEKPESKYKYFPSVVELASHCDILVVACALTEETRHIVNREVINALGPKGFVINIGRGPHIDEPELVSALVEGRIAGAGLDVFENEPKVPEELFGLDNVVLLPHVGSGTVETRNAMADLVIGNLEAHFSKKPLLTPVV